MYFCLVRAETLSQICPHDMSQISQAEVSPINRTVCRKVLLVTRYDVACTERVKEVKIFTLLVISLRISLSSTLSSCLETTRLEDKH